MRAALLLLLVARAASANPVDTFGFGARGAAMGGAQTAATQDGGANYYNPAALAQGDDLRIDVGYMDVKPLLRINDGSQNVDSSRGLAVALSAPGNIGKLHLAVGIGLFLPDEQITRTRAMPPTRPRWILYDNRPQRLFFAANIALRIARTFFIGGGVAYMSRTQGDITLEGRLGFPDAADSDLNLDINVDLYTIRYPQVGMLWRPRPWLTVGATLRGRFVLQLEQGFTLRGDVGPEGAEPLIKDGVFALHSLATDLFQPLQLAFGIAAQLTPRILLSADLTYMRWSDFDNPAAKITFNYDLKDFNDLVNLPDAAPLPNAYFHDTFVPRVGLEILAARTLHTAWRVRGGYAYEQSPAPEQIGETNFVDNDKHTFSLGLGVEVAKVTSVLPRPFDIDVYFATTFLPDRAHRKLSPIDPVGDYVSSGSVLAGGIGSRWHF